MLTKEKGPGVVGATSEALPNTGIDLHGKYMSSSNSRQVLDETVRRLQKEKGKCTIFWGYEWPRVTREKRGRKR
jgi:hypothetical protein